MTFDLYVIGYIELLKLEVLVGLRVGEIVGIPGQQRIETEDLPPLAQQPIG
jgi:hypothetical protein